MIRVKIDIIPGGDEGAKSTARVIEIANVTRSEDLGCPVHTYEARETYGTWPQVETKEPNYFFHNRADGLEACIRRALVALYGGDK